MTNKFYIKSKAKTFYKGDDYGDIIEWFMSQIETHDYQPEGTDCGLLSPPDPVCELAKKYVITVKEVR